MDERLEVVGVSDFDCLGKDVHGNDVLNQEKDFLPHPIVHTLRCGATNVICTKYYNGRCCVETPLELRGRCYCDKSPND